MAKIIGFLNWAERQQGIVKGLLILPVVLVLFTLFVVTPAYQLARLVIWGRQKQ